MIPPGSVAWFSPDAKGSGQNGPGRLSGYNGRPDIESGTFGEVFERTVARLGDHIALIGNGERLTFEQVGRRSRELKKVIQATVPIGSAVTVLLPNSPASLISIIACMLASRTCVVLNADHPAERNHEIMRDAGVHSVIVDDLQAAHARSLPSHLNLIETNNVAAGEDTIGSSNDDPLLGPVQPIVLYTSGSTGRPKGIAISQDTVLRRVRWNLSVYGFTDADRLLSLNALGTIAGLATSLSALIAGATQSIVSVLGAGATSLLDIIENERVTLVWSVPSLLRPLLSAGKARAAFMSVRLVRVAGEPLPGSDIRLYRTTLPEGCRVIVTYGQTEIPGIAEWSVPRDFEPEGATIPVGYLVPDQAYAIVGEDGCSVPDGETGELLVKSRHMALGEWHDGRVMPGRTARDPADPRVGILATGDLVRLRSDGLLEITGRRDRQIKIRGQRIEPIEIEAVLRGVPGVRDAAVAARNTEDGAVLVAVVSRESSAPNSLLEDARKAASVRLPPVMRPSRILLAEQVPRLPGGKVDLEGVLALERQAALDNTAVVRGSAGNASPAASVRARRAVARAWVRTLGRASLAADRSIEEAGCDSLRFLVLLLRIEDATGAKLPLEEFDLGMRPGELATVVDRCLAAAPFAKNGSERVFLIDGGGTRDSPQLARFRRACRPLRFVVLDPGDWRDWPYDEHALDRVVRRLIAQIDGHGPDRPPIIAGYSLGGSLAFATAVALERMGRPVRFLGLLDSGLSPSRSTTDRRRGLSWPAWLEMFARERRAFGFKPAFLNELSYVVAESGSLRKVLGPLSRLAMRGKLGVVLDNFIGMQVRVSAWRAWSALHRQAEIEAPTVLLRTADHAPDAPVDLGWDKHCSSLRVITIAGCHRDLFDEPQLRSLAAAFVGTVSRSRDPAWGPTSTAVAG
jgi:acyl-coenzyme A synthetase/AMP-(fatty) acid ligase/thioesterase domain-containing protein